MKLLEVGVYPVLQMRKLNTDVNFFVQIMSIEHLSVQGMRLEAEIKAVGSKTASLFPPQSCLEADIKQKGKQIIIVVSAMKESREHSRDIQQEHLL